MVTESVGDSETSTFRKQVEDKWRMVTVTLRYNGNTHKIDYVAQL